MILEEIKKTILEKCGDQIGEFSVKLPDGVEIVGNIKKGDKENFIEWMADPKDAQY